MGNSFTSQREQKVRAYLMLGLSNKEIATLLGVTEKTIKDHCSRIFKKENVKSRLQYVLKEYAALESRRVTTRVLEALPYKNEG